MQGRTSDKVCSMMYKIMNGLVNDLLLFDERLVIPKCLRLDVLKPPS